MFFPFAIRKLLLHTMRIIIKRCSNNASMSAILSFLKICFTYSFCTLFFWMNSSSYGSVTSDWWPRWLTGLCKQQNFFYSKQIIFFSSLSLLLSRIFLVIYVQTVWQIAQTNRKISAKIWVVCFSLCSCSNANELLLVYWLVILEEINFSYFNQLIILKPLLY